METKIIDKIRKLIAKQKSAEQIGSLKEAVIFAAKIQDLLTKYNLEIMDIGDAQEKLKMGRVNFNNVINRKNEGKWEPMLYGILANFNYCRVVVHTINGKALSISMVGTKTNIEMVKFLGDQLQAKIRILEKVDWVEKGRHGGEKRGKFKKGFYLGAIKGIEFQLEKQRKAQITVQVKIDTLVVQTDKDLVNAIDKLFGPLKDSKEMKFSSGIGATMGNERGRNININKGIDSGDMTKSIK